MTVNYQNTDSRGNYNTKNISVTDTLSADKIYLLDFIHSEKTEGKKTIKSVNAVIKEISAEEYEEHLQVSNRFITNMKGLIYQNINELSDSALFIIVIIVLICLFLFFLKSWIGTGITKKVFRKSDAFIESFLIGVSESANKTLPAMIDSSTRLDATCALPGKIFQWHYTILIPGEQINLENIRNNLRPNILNNIKTNKALKDFRVIRVTMEHIYNDKDNNEVIKFTFEPKDYL